MRTYSHIAGLAVALVWLVGCAQPQTHQAWASTDSWFRPPSDWLRFRQAQSLQDTDIAEVAVDHMSEAEEQLRDVACIEISADHATQLVGRPVPAKAGSSLFLVRAVYLNRGTGKFMAVPVGRELLVEHGSLGHSAVPMNRQALVVRLSQRPEKVYVSCSMVE